MIYFKLYDTEAAHESEAGHPQVKPMVFYAIDEDIVHYHSNSLDPITVQGLIDAGYATVDTSGRIQILSSSIYPMDKITDFIDVLTNNKKVINPNTSEAFANNSFIWSEALPASWTAQELADVYTANALNLGMGTLSGDYNAVPRFYGVDFTGVDSMTITMNGGSWNVIGRGIFNEGRHNYDTSQWENGPETVNFILTSSYSSVAQTPFTAMKGTKNFNFTCPDFGCHDTAGMFEYSFDLENFTISGRFDWQAIRNVTNMFHNCYKIKEIPLGYASQARDGYYNTIYARYDQWRGSASLDQAFMNCEELTSIKPTLNLNAALPAYANYNGGTFTGCNKLSDIRIKNLNNGSWNFSSSNPKTYLPAMDVDSINYLLNNVATNISLEYALAQGYTIEYPEGKTQWNYDRGQNVYYTDSTKTAYTVTATDYVVPVAGLGFSVTLPATHQSEVDSAAIASAQAKGWTVTFA